nr:MAG TPA: hypothetical protein [Caudoviricetes sp.]
MISVMKEPKTPVNRKRMKKMGMMSVLRSRAGRKKSSWNCFFITAAVM